MKKAIHIFYKDLNLHSGIYELAQTHHILPVFLWCEQLNQDVDLTPSLKYRLEWAKAFNQLMLPKETNLLMVNCFDDIETLCKLYNIDTVTMLRHYEPREVAFQKKMAQDLYQLGIKYQLLAGYAINAPDKILKSDGSPYRVFTPYYNKWRRMLNVISVPKNTIYWLSQPIVPVFENYGYKIKIEADFKQFDTFIKQDWQMYIKKRDFPYHKATSNLSALLNHGLVSVNDILTHVFKQPHNDNWEAFVRQLAWRDFYMMILYYFPQTIVQNFNHKISFKWSNQALDFYLWCEGKTGYPLVDAAMKCLYNTGRMHNRLRMITASFLCKDLLIHWSQGATWFKEHLIDYDLASNIGGWQWSASTGADAVPYFRIFNPTSQSEKYDPHGDFIRTYITDLTTASSKKIHDPQKYGVPYIAKCIDHSSARKRVLASFSKSKDQ